MPCISGSTSTSPTVKFSGPRMDLGSGFFAREGFITNIPACSYHHHRYSYPYTILYFTIRGGMHRTCSLIN